MQATELLHLEKAEELLRVEWGAVVLSDPRHVTWHTPPSLLCLSLFLALGFVPSPPLSFSLWDPNVSYLLTKGPLNLDPAPSSSSSNPV